ncbi:unnamed protein product, partial [Adineta steineri]
RENTDPCAVCWVEPPAYMDAIPCTHRKTFCQTCVEKVRAGDNVKCPMCRTPWSVNIYRENMDRNAMITVNERQTMEHHSSPPTATGGLMHDVLTCCEYAVSFMKRRLDHVINKYIFNDKLYIYMSCRSYTVAEVKLRQENFCRILTSAKSVTSARHI